MGGRAAQSRRTASRVRVAGVEAMRAACSARFAVRISRVSAGRDPLRSAAIRCDPLRSDSARFVAHGSRRRRARNARTAHGSRHGMRAVAAHSDGPPDRRKPDGKQRGRRDREAARRLDDRARAVIDSGTRKNAKRGNRAAKAHSYEP
ncbi:hypothetical protein BHT10_04415 [Burkholderia pseudomallei]|nr:hypothetical protein BHT10_04415 [Burkholderia pseudomallei]AYX36578.1 hypothetical protein EGY15_16910 [Burkholderia pseudomallei]